MNRSAGSIATWVAVSGFLSFVGPTPLAGAAEPPELGVPRLAEEFHDDSSDLVFIDPQASVLEMYRALGRDRRLAVLFDPNLRDRPMAFESRGVSTAETLERLARAAGHFVSVLDARSVYVTLDTPQNRRTYENVALQVFALEHADATSIVTALRSLVSVKAIAVDSTGRLVSVRDTSDRVALAAEVIRRLDQPPSEIAVDLEVVRLPGAKAGEPWTSGHRDAATAARLRREGTLLAGGRLSMIGERAATWARHDGPDAGTGLDLEVEIEARAHSATGRFTLDVVVTGGPPPAADPPRSRWASSWGVTAGGTLVLTTDAGGGAGSGGATVVLLTPTMVQPGPAGDAKALWVGTEAFIRSPRSE